MLNSYIKEPNEQAIACVIWMHGLGADASDMSGLAGQLMLSDIPIRHIFLDAPIRPVTINNGISMRAWYDIFDLGFTRKEDKEGILISEEQILKAVQTQIEQGMTSDKIFLAGFSQGGAMALHTALQMTRPLGGVIALSSYLPLASECKPSLASNTPMFLGYGAYDTIVLPAWSKLTIDWLSAHSYRNLSWHEYPMEHSICMEEVKDLSLWLGELIKRSAA
ncbi:carboxylesterase/phospholipase [Legionella hackeliae]|uniref:Carboxylesterase/phospholipase n=1 Tax=Legionella hackeliae TaxID=449 RepID=A0A0A8UKV3_LEGHA|nr:carboxylesterase/phospholipase [Legionella hackeliae]CEK09495.1 Carboxylesterase/phospholipase [Legionella hackeliae]STX49402.1 carboxylesterase/phospholipase [Legionella hackeliae]